MSVSSKAWTSIDSESRRVVKPGRTITVCEASHLPSADTQGMRRLVAEVVRPSSKPAEVLRDSAAYCLDLREVDMITASGWQPRYARRADHMKASEIRELLKLLERPGIISFAGGIPDPELLCTLTRPASNTVPTSARQQCDSKPGANTTEDHFEQPRKAATVV